VLASKCKALSSSPGTTPTPQKKQYIVLSWMYHRNSWVLVLYFYIVCIIQYIAINIYVQYRNTDFKIVYTYVYLCVYNIYHTFTYVYSLALAIQSLEAVIPH
jgi:hypothetical protein